MRFGGAFRGVAIALLVATTATPSVALGAIAKKAHHVAPSAQQQRQLAHVRKEMRAALHRERLRHRARIGELAHRGKMARHAKDLDEQQRVTDLVQAERMLFAQRMRDIRAKAPEPR